MTGSAILWGWDDDNDCYRRILVDSTGKVQILSTVGNLNDIGDVNAPSPSDGQALTWDDGTSKWIPATPSGGYSARARAYANVLTQSIKTATWTKLVFDTEEFDENNELQLTADSGTTTSDGSGTNKLIEAGQNFQSTVVVGDVVHNETDDVWTEVSAVDSDTQLSVSAGEGLPSGKAYTIYRARYTPTAEGYYLITGSGVFSGLSDQVRWIIAVVKNGATYMGLGRGYSAVGGTTYNGAGCATIVYLNGSTDYVEIKVYHAEGSDIAMYDPAQYQNITVHRLS